MKRTLAVFFGFLIFGLILFLLIGDAVVDEGWLESHGRWMWLAATALFIADIFIPIPTTVILTELGHSYGPLAGGLIGTLGVTLSGLTAYGLTRGLGPGFARWLLGDELEKAETFFREKGPFAVACSRWLPLLPEAISCMAGLARMPFKIYIAALVCGTLPMCLVYSSIAVVSDLKVVTLLLSALLPIPIWLIAGRLLRLQWKTKTDSP